MNSAQQIAVVTGAFDDLKSRDLRLLEEASRSGALTVLLRSDESIRKLRGKPPKFSQAERLYLLQAIRYGNEVRLVDEVAEDALPDLANFKPGIWVVDAARDSAAKQAFCKSRAIQYRVVRDAELAGFPEPPPQQPTTASGRKKVIVTGCYDWFHSGHVRFFEEAASYGELFVVVGHDANIRLLKGEGRPLFPAEERRYMVGSVRCVQQAFISTGDGWLDAEPEIQRIKPDIYLVNEDGDVPEKRDYCAKHGLEYIVLKRTPAPGLPRRSSTDLRAF